VGNFTGVLTKPDLVNEGTEETVLKIIQNEVIPLRKGYMIVKCYGQMDFCNELSFTSAIQQEREFFETHKHFRYFSHKEPNPKYTEITSNHVATG